MYKIKTMNKISPVGLSKVNSAKFSVADEYNDEDGIIVRSASLHEYDMPTSLKAIARAGAGVNNIPLDACSEKGIVAFNTPGANANAVKELVVLGLLMSSRKVFPAMNWVQTQDVNEDVSKLVEKGKSQFTGPELTGKTLGVIGLGAIGIKVANIAVQLGMNVLGYDPYLSVDNALSLSQEVKHVITLDEVYKNADYISLHLPQTSDTKGMINSESIKSMKYGMRILNFARAGLVNDEDMIAALEEGSVKVYVTDFPNEKLLNNSGVLAIPHLGASTPESEENCAVMAVEQIQEYLENGNIINSVNLPNVSMPRSGSGRLGIIHRNMPNMIAQISNAISNANLNIENLENKSRGEYAYFLVDINGADLNAVVENISKIDGVLKVNQF